MLVNPLKTLRFGDRATARTAAGETITGTIQTFWGRVHGAKLVGLLKEGGSPLVPEMHFVPVEELQPAEERSGRSAPEPSRAPNLGTRLACQAGLLGAVLGAGIVGLALLVDAARAGELPAVYTLQPVPDCVYDPNLQAMICRVDAALAPAAGEAAGPAPREEGRGEAELNTAALQRLFLLWQAMQTGSHRW